MKLLEQFLCGKENRIDTCEDGIVIGEHLIAVIDGVTAKGCRLWDEKTSGCYAKCVLEQYLKQDVGRKGYDELLEDLDLILHEIVSKEPDDFPPEEYPRASIIIYNDYYNEIWSYGDCQCMINETIYNHSKEIDVLNAGLRAFCLEYLISHGHDINDLKRNDLGRENIEQYLLMQFSFENKRGMFGYPVLNGMGIEASMIKRYAVTKGDRVILATDGYPVLRGTLEESEKELAYIIENDPLCFRLYRSTKGIKQGNSSFDDRAFCSFIV